MKLGILLDREGARTPSLLSDCRQALRMCTGRGGTEDPPRAGGFLGYLLPS